MKTDDSMACLSGYSEQLEQCFVFWKESVLLKFLKSFFIFLLFCFCLLCALMAAETTKANSISDFMLGKFTL